MSVAPATVLLLGRAVKPDCKRSRKTGAAARFSRNSKQGVPGKGSERSASPAVSKSARCWAAAESGPDFEARNGAATGTAMRACVDVGMGVGVLAVWMGWVAAQ